MSKGTELLDTLVRSAADREFEEGSGRSDPGPREEFDAAATELRRYITELEALVDQATDPRS